MINSRDKTLGIILILIFLSALNQARSQDSLNQLLNNPAQPAQEAPKPALPTQAQKPPSPSDKIPKQATNETAKKKRFHFFWVNEQKNEQREKHRKELETLKNRQKQEIEDLKKKAEAKKAQEATLQKKVMEKQTESMSLAQKIIDERNKEVKEIKRSNNTVEIITSEEDPLYIKKAQVLESKTNFMEIKDVEFKYKLELHNQTPKIINFVLIVWEKKLAFNNTQTLAKQVKVAKPITPYEKRIVEHNELNSRREGETYKVKIVKIVFEDGTQWKNPAIKDTAL